MANCFFCYKDAGESLYHPACCKKFFGTPDLPVLEINMDNLRALATENISSRVAVTGAQPKFSASLEKIKNENRLTSVGLWGEFIMKPPHPDFDWMVETEDLTMHLASLFKIRVCGHTVLPDSKGNLVYLAKRFDRVKKQKIHVEDLCQLSEFLTENKYKGSYEKAGKIIRKYCPASIDVINYFELVVYSFLTGNNDMHLKNFSLIHAPAGPYLSPAYDLLNINLVFPQDKEEMALTLNGKKSRLKRIDFEVLGQALQLPEKVVSNVFGKFISKNKQVFHWIDRSFLGEEQKELFKTIWLSKQKIFINS
jgi:serine/threonine-protein kinase HipA